MNILFSLHSVLRIWEIFVVSFYFHFFFVYSSRFYFVCGLFSHTYLFSIWFSNALLLILISYSLCLFVIALLLKCEFFLILFYFILWNAFNHSWFQILFIFIILIRFDVYKCECIMCSIYVNEWSVVEWVVE